MSQAGYLRINILITTTFPENGRLSGIQEEAMRLKILEQIQMLVRERFPYPNAAECTLKKHTLFANKSRVRNLTFNGNINFRSQTLMSDVSKIPPQFLTLIVAQLIRLEEVESVSVISDIILTH